ncbi:MAG TPA: hypothetical protein VD993_20690 [Chitinophagaceae bacterium]|nr:hypothetical protein [Chitinophagaceae bacterium]
MRLFLLIAICFPFNPSLAQDNKVQVFKVVTIPSNIAMEHPGIKDSLNKQLAKALSKQDAFRIVNNQLKAYKNYPIHIRQQLQDNKFNYLIYYVTAPKETGISIVDVKASRDIIDEDIFKKYQLQLFFTDTISIIDTLRISIYPDDFNYRIKDYHVLAGDDGLQKIYLPFKGPNTLLLCAADFASLEKQPVKCELHHRSLKEKPVSTFHVRFLGPRELEELRGVAETIIAENRGNHLFSDANVMVHLKEYARVRWGVIQGKNLSWWLKKTFPDVRT